MARAVNSAANVWVARVLPFVLVGIVGYVTWAVTVEICVKYLLHPGPNRDVAPNHGAAGVVLLLYYTLLIFMAWAYFRLLYAVTFTPGYVERSEQWLAQNEAKEAQVASLKNKTRISKDPVDAEKATNSFEYDVGEGGAPRLGQGPKLQSFIARSAYICQGDGRPLWCSACQNWKPDRTHHCRECNRCVRKMDHFCPWVGGVVSETSFKFFIQFVSWTFLFCLFNLILTAVLLAQERHQTGRLNVHWLISLVFAALFGAFTLGMAGASLQFVFCNSTTIENLSRKTVVYQIAVHIPQPQTLSEKPPFQTVSFAIPSRPNTRLRASSASSQTSVHGSQEQGQKIKTFAILRTTPGENPWDLGYSRNFQEVMGRSWHEWFLPIRMSPCTEHIPEQPEFRMGPVVSRLLDEAIGLSKSMKSSPSSQGQEKDPHVQTHRRRHRHRRRRKRTKHRVDDRRSQESGRCH